MSDNPALATPAPAQPAILIIDDNPLNLAVLEKYLFEQGFEVLVARDSESGLTYARHVQPDLILLDIYLPDQDGFATCRQLKADPRTCTIPVIFVTALTDDIQAKLRGFELGAVDYIVKPFQETEVLARITTHLRLQALTRQLQQQTETLQMEVNERKRAETELRSYQEQLELLVQARTTELRDTNARLKMSLHEKEILLKEIHHRVKNNLQIIASLLYLQAQKVDAPQLVELFHESQNRITSMAFVHEMLYQSDDYTRVDFSAYVRSLATSLLASYGVDQRRITLTIDAPEITMNITMAIPCGLIVNEVISNALKHAFPNDRQGSIRIEIARQPGGQYLLALHDDGVGLPAQARAQNNTLGLRLVSRLVRQLGGTVAIRSNPGTSYQITFPQNT